MFDLQRLLGRLDARPRRRQAPGFSYADVADDEVIRAIRSVPCHYADLSITAANVIVDPDALGTATTDSTHVAGVALTAGQAVYLDTTGKYQLSLANGTAAQKACAGIVTDNAAANQPVTVQTSGVINLGATLTVAKIYVVSGAVAGNIAPVTDLVTGWVTIILGVATAANRMTMKIFNSTAVGP